MEPINPLSTILPVGSATSQGGSRGRESFMPDRGQLLLALVTGAKGEQRFTLEVAGREVLVRSESPLQVGQKLQLEVTRTSPQVELRIISDTLNQLIGKSLTLLGNKLDLAGLFTALKQVTPSPLPELTPATRNVLADFESLSQKPLDNREGGDTLRQLLTRLGLSMEALLAKGDGKQAATTLKAALLEMVAKFSTAEKLTESTNRLLSTIELFQLIQLQTGSERALIFPLPFSFVEQGYLLIEQDGDNDQGGTKSGESRFSLHLRLTGLGNLRVDFLHNDDGLYIRFHTEDQERATFFASFAEELKSALSAARLVGLSFAADARDPVNELLSQFLPDRSSVLDTRV